MPPLIPDVPYKIQGIFIVTFSYIWTTAFVDNYEDPLPADGPEREEILVSSGWSKAKLNLKCHIPFIILTNVIK